MEKDNSDIIKAENPDTGMEHDITPELPLNCDVGIILSSGYRELESQDKILMKNLSSDDEKKYRLSNDRLDLESKIRCLAGGMLAQNGRIKELILSGGHVYGKENPSVAEGMKEYILKHFPDLKDFPIITEEDSMDTSENAEFIQKMIKEKNIETAFLITSKSHLKRASKLFKEYGVETFPVDAETELAERSNRHGVYTKKYLESDRNLKNESNEKIFRAMMVIDPKQKLLRMAARILRNGFTRPK